MLENKYKVILDTDIGDDIDDAFALAFLLCSPEVELLGVTTVFRNSAQRARMAKYLIKMFDKDVPVYAGIDDPIKQKPEDLLSMEVKSKIRYDENGKYCIPQYEDIYDNEKYDGDDAISFMAEQIEKYPHEVVLCVIGPETNIAALIQKRPDLVPLIKEIRIMGGAVGETINFPEWNILCDPESAKIVYESGIKIYATGCNVTLQCPLSDENIAILKSIKNQRLETLVNMLNKWLEHYSFTRPVLHDPLAVSTLLKDYVVFKEEKMKVILEGEKRGWTIPSEDGTLINVGVALNKDNDFISEIKNRIFH